MFHDRNMSAENRQPAWQNRTFSWFWTKLASFQRLYWLVF